jgi:hypothetical protein
LKTERLATLARKSDALELFNAQVRASRIQRLEERGIKIKERSRLAPLMDWKPPIGTKNLTDWLDNIGRLGDKLDRVTQITDKVFLIASWNDPESEIRKAHDEFLNYYELMLDKEMRDETLTGKDLSGLLMLFRKFAKHLTTDDGKLLAIALLRVKLELQKKYGDEIFAEE